MGRKRSKKPNPFATALAALTFFVILGFLIQSAQIALEEGSVGQFIDRLTEGVSDGERE